MLMLWVIFLFCSHFYIILKGFILLCRHALAPGNVYITFILQIMECYLITNTEREELVTAVHKILAACQRYMREQEVSLITKCTKKIFPEKLDGGTGYRSTRKIRVQ